MSCTGVAYCSELVATKSGTSSLRQNLAEAQVLDSSRYNAV